VIDTSVDEGAIIRALKKDPTRNEEEALKEIYKRLRPGEPPTTANAKALLKRLFFDPKRYDLGRVGRYKVNQKLGLKIDSSSASSRAATSLPPPSISSASSAASASSTTSITSVPAASAPSASCSPTSAASA
jgi:hypothetical protein